jgi:hypothetical protein
MISKGSSMKYCTSEEKSVGNAASNQTRQWRGFQWPWWFTWGFWLLIRHSAIAMDFWATFHYPGSRFETWASNTNKEVVNDQLISIVLNSIVFLKFLECFLSPTAWSHLIRLRARAHCHRPGQSLHPKECLKPRISQVRWISGYGLNKTMEFTWYSLYIIILILYYITWTYRYPTNKLPSKK